MDDLIQQIQTEFANGASEFKIRSDLLSLASGSAPDNGLQTIANWIALSKDGKTLYATSQEPSREHGTVAVIDIASREVLKFIEAGPRPKRIHLVEIP